MPNRESRCFRTIVVVDFEYEIDDGDLPRVLCMVAYLLDTNLRHVGTARVWRGEFGSTPPFDVGPDSLVVGYSLWAELTCFLTLGWRFPVHVYDLHTAFLATSNILLPYNPDEVRKKPRKRLPDACRAYGIEGWEKIMANARSERRTAEIAATASASAAAPSPQRTEQSQEPIRVDEATFQKMSAAERFDYARQFPQGR